MKVMRCEESFEPKMKTKNDNEYALLPKTPIAMLQTRTPTAMQSEELRKRVCTQKIRKPDAINAVYPILDVPRKHQSQCKIRD